jgi:excisionase family DNA binding protein
MRIGGKTYETAVSFDNLTPEHRARMRAWRRFEDGLLPERDHERAALSRQEAADALGVSLDTLERRILPRLRTVRVGGRVLIPRDEITRWLDREAR